MPNLMQKIKDLWTPPDDEYYETEDAEDYSNREKNNAQSTSKRSQEKGSKVVNLHTTAQLQVVLFKPERFGEETRLVAEELLKTHTVVLNLENTIRDSIRRILDFLSGVAYANGGKIKRVATSTFIITPYNVDLTGDDILDELENSGLYF